MEEIKELLNETNRYPAYKDSGIEWLGEIPAHWEVKRLKYAAQIIYGISPNEKTYNDIGEGVVLVNGPVEYSESEFGYTRSIKWTTDPVKFAKKGSLLFCLRGSTTGRLNICHQDLAIGRGCASILSFENQGFLINVMLSLKDAIIDTFKGSTFPSVTSTDLNNYFVTIPPFPEQTIISQYLDEKCAKIDQALAQKAQLIDLLKERKQIMIQQAVTQGLNPQVKRKHSGIDWIGEIPAHWEVKMGKYLFREVSEKSQEGIEELLSVSHLTGVTPRSEKDVNMFLAEDYTGSKLCRKGDLVFNIMWTWMGALGIADRTGIVSPSYGVYRAFDPNAFNPIYLEALLKTSKYIEYYNKISTGLHSSRLRFYAHMFFNMKIGYAPREEQDEIVTHIETQSTKIDQAIALQQQQIERLQEYKASLINAVVTGKRRVG